ncbi:AraC family transcriptional regulator [Patulibacter defluvii]|uniref:AraC family transcriptional regulator n=1 Tax=Patulibacter defluvii TaxID=3095358 RepID=UPI002A75D421|nr:AraC family transcriptional regulator [Patulibacter sp. DM4]
MDTVAGLLEGPRARGAFLLRSLLDPPWSLRIEDQAPLTVVAVVEGGAWILPAGPDAAWTAIGPGDVALVRGPEPYLVADDPSTPPQVVIHPGQRCTTLDGEDLALAMRLGVRSWGNAADAGTVMLTGTYQQPGEVSGRLVAALPPLAVVRASEWRSPLVALLRDEIVRDGEGQGAVLDRLLDLLLVAVLREWFARPEAEAPGWYRAQADPVVGPALRLLQADPARAWTVEALAHEVGMSRAGLARRFSETVGEAPMAFLTGWRLALAADLLCEPGSTIASVAERVGYGSPFALSAAFKRVRGISPQEHRARVAAAPIAV